MPKDPAFTHQRRIAIATLKLSKSGALILGGMTHKEACAFLRRNDWSDTRLRAHLSRHEHPEGDILEFLA